MGGNRANEDSPFAGYTEVLGVMLRTTGTRILGASLAEVATTDLQRRIEARQHRIGH
jgi:hypothetical protein